MNTLINYVRSGQPDLTNRQMALMLLVYLTPGPHTVRGLAQLLGVSKPVITRALNTLGSLGYLRRVRDESDRRNVFVARTSTGQDFLDGFEGNIEQRERRQERAAGERIPPPERMSDFHLTGPSLTLDARIHAYRNDIADIGLAGQIFAPHYARPLLRGCGARPALVRATPAAEAEAVSELLPGEAFAVLEYAGGLAWGYCRADHVTGYVEAIALADPIDADPHRLREMRPRSPPTTTSPPRSSPPCRWARASTATSSGACLATEYGCVALSHLRPFGDHEADPVSSPSG